MSRSCRPLWLTCATLPDHLDMADLCLRCPAPLPCVQVLALLARFSPASRRGAASCRWSSWGLIRLRRNLYHAL